MSPRAATWCPRHGLDGPPGGRGFGRLPLNLLTAVLAIGDQLPKDSEQERAAAEAPRRPGRTASVTSSRWQRGHRRSATPCWITRRAGGLAAGPRHRQLLQDLPRVRRRRARGQSHPGQHPRQHHAVLADRHRSVGGPVVLGGRTSVPQRLRAASLLRRSRCRSASPRSPARSGRRPSWVEAVYPTFAYFNEADRGGHFAAWEEPELFATEIRAAFRPAALTTARTWV